MTVPAHVVRSLCRREQLDSLNARAVTTSVDAVTLKKPSRPIRPLGLWRLLKSTTVSMLDDYIGAVSDPHGRGLPAVSLEVHYHGEQYGKFPRQSVAPQLEAVPPAKNGDGVPAGLRVGRLSRPYRR